MKRAAFLLFLASPAAANTFDVRTSADDPVASFETTDAKVIAQTLADRCLARGWRITQQTDFMIECQNPYNTGGSYAFLYKNARELLRFQLIGGTTETRVQAVSILEARNGFGAVSEMRGAQKAQGAVLLIEAGGRMVSGAEIRGRDVGFYGLDQFGFLVTLVRPGSPASAAGIAVNDVIERVNGKRTFSGWDLQKAFAKLAPGASVAIEVKRGRAKVPLVLTIPAN